MKSGTVARTLSLCIVLSAAVPAYATPFETRIAPTTAEQGKPITVSLVIDSSVTDLTFADFGLTFDPDIVVFDYLKTKAGLAIKDNLNFLLQWGNPEKIDDSSTLRRVLFSLATVINDDPVDKEGSLVDVHFQIKSTAGIGDSNFYFESTRDSDYYIQRTSGTVTVERGQPGTVPEPAASMLAGMGLLALICIRRRLT